MPMLTWTAKEPLTASTLAPWAKPRSPDTETESRKPPASRREPHLSVQFSPVIAARHHFPSRGFSVMNVDLQVFRELASPLATFDEFRVSAAVCGPHPHAGFSTVNYLFEDSRGSLRSRDSLGNDLLTRPGGLLWTQAARGLVHDEFPADLSREVHGLQLNVNLAAQHKLAAPAVFHFQPDQIPQWRNDSGDRVRVVAGNFAGHSSPLAPADSFSLFDVRLRSAIGFDLPMGHNAMVYLISGAVQVVANGHARRLEARQAVAFQGIRDSALVQLIGCGHVIVVTGAEIREPMISDGPFIMNYPWQIDAAYARFHAGEMGRLDSIPIAGTP